MLGRKSGPGHVNRLASVRLTQDREESSPKRFFVAGGISKARAGLFGGVWVIGKTVTISSPSNSCTTRMMAQGRSLTPSSCPRKYSARHRYE
jgi:hypothetical protein